jgi:putative tryptophan/tyrosine transport system ATP-binding protein
MLKLLNITKTYPLTYSPAVNNISLDIAKGQLCVLIGSNGSGKSTLIKTIRGDFATDGGKIILDEEDITPLPPHVRARSISAVSQEVTKGTVSELTVLENFALSLIRERSAHFQGYRKQTELIRAHVANLKVGLESYIDKPMSALSGGQRQMLSMAMATMATPKLLLLDEHCSALDPKTQVKLMEYTAHIVREKAITCLMITHHLDDALRYGDRLIMMHAGKIIMDVSGEEKKSLNLKRLLELFHQQEDTLLIGGQS